MNIEQINWDKDSNPECENGDIVVLVQYKEAEIAKYISPKPQGVPDGGGDFIFEVCDNDDNLEEEIYKIISKQYPEVKQKTDDPLLFLCPSSFFKKVIWNE